MCRVKLANCFTNLSSLTGTALPLTQQMLPRWVEGGLYDKRANYCPSALGGWQLSFNNSLDRI